MFIKRHGALFRGNVPEFDNLIIREGDQSLHVRVESDSLRGSAVTTEAPEECLRGHIKKSDCPLLSSSGQELAIGAEGGAKRSIFELVERLNHLIGLGVI